MRKTELETAQADFKKSNDALEGQIKTVNQSLADREKELTEQRTTVETAQETAKTALTQAEARTKETDLLHNQLLAVTKQSDEYKIQQNELQDQIRIQERQLGNREEEQRRPERARAGAFQRAPPQRPFPTTTLRSAEPLAPRPDVEGEVTRVDARNQRVEISIGSDDGLVVGHELQVFRTKPTAEFIGKIRLESVDPDQAVGKVHWQHPSWQKDSGGRHCRPKNPAAELANRPSLPSAGRPAAAPPAGGARQVYVQTAKNDVFTYLLAVSLGAILIGRHFPGAGPESLRMEDQGGRNRAGSGHRPPDLLTEDNPEPLPTQGRPHFASQGKRGRPCCCALGRFSRTVRRPVSHHPNRAVHDCVTLLSPTKPEAPVRGFSRNPRWRFGLIARIIHTGQDLG